MITRLALIAAFLLPFCLISCACSESTSSSSSVLKMQDLLGKWDLSKLNGQSLGLPSGATVPSLEFRENGEVSGFAGVNRLNSAIDPASLSKGNINFGPMAMTRMAGPEELMNIESEFTAALDKVDHASLDNGQLVLSQDATELLRFSKAQ